MCITALFMWPSVILFFRRGLQLGLVFQSGALFDSLTVGENVGFLLYEHSDLPPHRIKVNTSGSMSAALRRNLYKNPIAASSQTINAIFVQQTWS